MDTPDPVFGLTRTDLKAYFSSRLKPLIIERQYFDGVIERLPEEMPVPPEWAKEAYVRITRSLNAFFAKASQTLEANPNDCLSLGQVHGVLHTFFQQQEDVVEESADGLGETFHLPQENVSELKTLMSFENNLTVSEQEAEAQLLGVSLYLANSVSLSIEDAKQYHKGYLRGLDFQFGNEPEVDGSRLTILTWLWKLWPKVVQCESIRALHRFLNHFLKYQADPDAEPKQLEAICREIGLKLAARGRPKKS